MFQTNGTGQNTQHRLQTEYQVPVGFSCKDGLLENTIPASKLSAFTQCQML